MKLSEIDELEQMRRDFERAGCWIKICGGMKEKGESDHDLDLIVRIMDKNWKGRLTPVVSTIKKWNRAMQEKYGLGLDVIIQDRKKTSLRF